MVTFTVATLIQLEYSCFTEATVPICTFTLYSSHIRQCVSSFIRLSEFRGADKQAPRTLEAIKNHSCGWYYECSPDEFKRSQTHPLHIGQAILCGAYLSGPLHSRSLANHGWEWQRAITRNTCGSGLKCLVKGLASAAVIELKQKCRVENGSLTTRVVTIDSGMATTNMW